jgi:indole-3-pyruvate monooxygenase
MSYPVDAPTYIPKNQFIKYLDDYIQRFNIQPKYLTVVESSTYDMERNCWSIIAHDMEKCTTINYKAKFLVVASGENSEENIPVIPGLEDFPGVVIHSSRYKSGISYSGRNVLVVGSGNSGMEIAYDLASHGANTSIVIRSPVCVLDFTTEFFSQFFNLILLCVWKMVTFSMVADTYNDKGINPTRDDTKSPASTEASG